MHPIFRLTSSSDESTLWTMLTHAASLGSGDDAAVREAQSDPYLSLFVRGWATDASDLGVIAETADGEALAAAWIRPLPEDGPFCLGSDQWPELATAVVPAARGLGLGTATMRRLIDAARGKVPGIALSVRAGNSARRFYERLGFVTAGELTNRVGGVSSTMRLDLQRSEPA